MRLHPLVFIGLVAVAGAVAAQTQAPAKAPAAAASAVKAKDCVKPHDHGMERGAGSTVPNPCMPAAKASGVPAKKVHDHAKVHNK